VQQLVSVTAASTRSTVGMLTLWRRAHGCWAREHGPWQARLGFGGLSAHRHEGDGTTPLGVFGLGDVMYGTAADPGVRFAYHRLVCGDWWDEDPASSGYNTFRHVPCGVRPSFGGQSEALWQSTRAYRHLVVVEFNTGPTVPGRGSGIFIHGDLGHPTNGCISLPATRLVALLRWLDPAAAPRVSIAVRSG
jgi:L,D-peptidoglycan transpeptidase YkuD (ErfK/YbiS/YcfS/YnhG family)